MKPKLLENEIDIQTFSVQISKVKKENVSNKLITSKNIVIDQTFKSKIFTEDNTSEKCLDEYKYVPIPAKRVVDSSSDESSYETLGESYDVETEIDFHGNIFDFICEKILPLEIRDSLFTKTRGLKQSIREQTGAKVGGILNAVYYYCGLGNLDEINLIDIIFISLYWEIEINFVELRFLRRTFKCIKIDFPKIAIQFTRYTEPISKEFLPENYHRNRSEVEEKMKVLFLNLITKKIWNCFMTLHEGDNVDLYTLEIRKTANKQQKTGRKNG